MRVLGAESVRSLRIPYLFLAGLSEKVFPPPDREDRLYSEAEYLRLIEAGLPLVARTERTREEMLLFYEAVTRATKRLYLSYPALDEAAQPLLPSPFLERGRAGVRARPNPAHRADRLESDPAGRRAALPGRVPRQSGRHGAGRERGAAGRADAGRRRRQGRGQRETSETEIRSHQIVSIRLPLSLVPSPLSSSLAAGLELIDLRQDRDRFGPAEGVLQGEAAQRYLAARFPPQHIFAATDLERYASCPFRFFLERVLKIEPVEDLPLEFDVLAARPRGA